MNGERYELLRQGRRLPEREALRNALWSFHVQGAGLDASMLPNDLRPIPLAEAMEAASGWDDKHAHDRRVGCLRQLQPEFLREADKGGARAAVGKKGETAGVTRAAVQKALDDARREADRWSRSFGQKYRLPLPPTRDVFAKLASARCIPRVDKPSLKPETGQTFLKSGFEVQQSLKPELAYLVDPRNWDECSDLFDLTYRIEKPSRGSTDEIPPKIRSDPNAPATDWQGFLYELAGVGPQAVENILRINFVVTRKCTSHGARRPPKCKAGTCTHDITMVNADYKLHESRSYTIGGITFPGLMRQNEGHFRATRLSDYRTEISVKKTIRFGRLTDWSTSAGVFDLGEILNYTAPAYLSLWIHDVSQVVPCCERLKSKP
jgi:hypothetical protein